MRRRPGGERPVSATESRDREFRGAVVYGAALAVTALLAYLFNAFLGRRLGSRDFATFGALLAALLALGGPVTALFGGAAMAAAREGRVPRPRWPRYLLIGSLAAAALALLPVPVGASALAWFAVAMMMWLLNAWNRGLLTGLGRLGAVGGSIMFEGLARIGFVLVLVTVGWGVSGAAAGLALGISAAVGLSYLLLPRPGGGEPGKLAPEVWASIVGLLFLGAVQFADVIAVRVVGSGDGGPYVAASFLARVALYAQIPAAAYALRKAAVAGPRVALPRSLLLALGPGLLVAGAMAVFPGPLLDLTYGGRYLQATGLVRVLGVALFLSGLAQVLIQLLMGAGRTAWVWSCSAVSIVGLAALFLFAEVGFALAWTMVAVHAAVLSVAVLHLRRALAAERGAEGAVLVLNWRDTKHPQGGGCEVYVEETARRLAAMGRRVTMFCADHGEAPRDEVVDGIRYIRRGTWRSVYLWAAAYHLLGRFGPHDVVLDVQNGVPFFSPLYCGRPVVVMVTHVHREQWGMVFGPLTARIGWWLESRLAPRVYRRASYIAISQATRDGLAAIGVAPERTAVVLAGGAEALEQPPTGAARGAEPSIAYLGRLVPNKRIELIIDALAALREDVPGLRLRVMGQGYWEDELRAHAERRGVAGRVVFEGFVDEETKRRILAESWVLTLTSVQEGWGIVVLEAAAQRTPTVAMRVGALSESVVDGETGLLADDFEGFVENLRRVLDRPDLRERLGEAASAHARRFTWDATAAGFDEVLTEAVARHGRDPVGSGALDPDPAPTAIPFVADI